MDLILPFKVGDVVETRSYNVGYRGAWFRCKITDMCIRSGHMECQVEYIDYPDERRKWNRLFKIPPKCRNQKASQNREIMLRPPFPRWCWENDIAELGPQTDVVAVVSSPWKVGDLIDWWYTDCFWTGKITELMSDDKVKIICPEIPLGEGGCWVADPKDLRPALDWSLEKGWSAPLSQENGECWHTARLIAGNQDTLSSSSDEEDIEQSCDGNKVLQRCLNGSFDSLEQEIRKCLNGASDTPKELVDQDVKQPANRNGRCCLESQTDSEGEPQKCMNEEPGVSLEAICSKVQLAPSETGECCMNSQADCPTSPVANSGQSPQFITNEQSSTPNFKKLKTSSEPDASLEVTNTKVQLAPNENGECCMNSQADCPTSPVANSGQSPQFLTDEQSSPPSFKKLKTSSEHASVKPTGTVSEATMKLRELVNKVKTSSEHVSVKPTGTVSEATMKLQELVNKIRRAQDLLQSVDYAPSSIVLAPWKFQENNPWQKRN
ncbi:uncharacterized protein LOC125545937 isoform X1 [Triticum urartu]|uniref:Agenet domain-containing protein n=2 Tax=Triticum urartu TaxID=4572 RepID=A0A8R7PYQ8_TRIUA|nr:uncharacterized protein LOC125545937 isoform X1 [Triticum urartu]